MTFFWTVVILAVVAAAALALATSVHTVRQYERGVVLRYGRLLTRVRQPGLTFLLPFRIDRLTLVNTQIVTMSVPAQDGITRDNVSVTVDAVVYFRVVDPEVDDGVHGHGHVVPSDAILGRDRHGDDLGVDPVSYTHLRAHETRHDLVC